MLLCVALPVTPRLAWDAWAQTDPTPVNFTIAFIGDQGLGLNAQAVLNLIKNEGADAVVHSGDFDYVDNPAAWNGQIDAILGADFPYFASVGNHDAAAFYGGGVPGASRSPYEPAEDPLGRRPGRTVVVLLPGDLLRLDGSGHLRAGP